MRILPHIGGDGDEDDSPLGLISNMVSDETAGRRTSLVRSCIT
jgi:hypothetical protein